MNAQEYSENPAVSAWVMAHAGSGKTHALVRRVIALLLNGADPRSIWCVTYTTIAASEMLERTFEQLQTLAANHDDAALQKTLTSYLGYAATAAHVQLLREVALKISYPANALRCTTMHGLCQYILRIFALELGLSPTMHVLEEEAQADMLADACRHILSQALMPDHHASEAVQFILSALGSYAALEGLLSSMMQQRSAWLDLRRHRPDAKARAAFIYQACGATYGLSRAALLADIHAATPPEMQALAEHLRSGTKTDHAHAERIVAWLHATEHQHAARFDDYAAVFVTEKGEARKSIGGKHLQKTPPLASLAVREQARILRACDALSALACAQGSAHMATLFDMVEAAYGDAKRASGALDFDDMAFFVQQLFSSPESAGYVMQKLDQRVHHLLLDEAQDTSPEQWRILMAMVEEMFAASAGADGARSVFVVGDTKQSIYSFQGAAPWLLDQQRVYLEQLANVHRVPFVIRTLSEVRRSAPGILQLVDAVGEVAPIRRGWMEEAIAHRSYRKAAASRICWLPAFEDGEAAAREAYALPAHGEATSRGEHHLCEALAEHIATRLLADASLRPRDIMIIVRRRGRLVPALIRALSARGIAVAGTDRIKLSAHCIVQDIVALVDWCFQPEDDLALAHVLRSPIGGLSEDALCEIAHARVGSLWQALACNPQYHALATELQAYRAARHVPVYRFLSQLVDGYHHRDHYTARLGSDAAVILNELMDMACILEASGKGDVLSFAARMKQSNTEIKRPASAENSVRILTVHGAKGLEARWVILADMAEMPSTTKDRFFLLAHERAQVPLIAIGAHAARASAYTRAKAQRKSMLEDEYYRQFYVAITRARDELTFATARKTSYHDECWHALAQQVIQRLPGVETDDTGALIWRHTPDVSDAEQPEAKKAEPSPAALDEARLAHWQAVAAAGMPLQPQRQILSPSRLGGKDEEAPPHAEKMMDDAHDPRALGTVVHGLLSWWHDAVTRPQIEAFVRASGLSDHDGKLALTMTMRLIETPEMRALLMLPHRAEQAVAASSVAGPFTYGVMDRLIIRAHDWLMVDFKTSTRVPAVSSPPQAYVAQLAWYRHVLQQAYPHQQITCGLWWVSAPRLDIIEDSALNAALVEITNNLAVNIPDRLDAA